MRWYAVIGAIFLLVLMPAFVAAHEGMMGHDDDDEQYMYMNQNMNGSINGTNGSLMPGMLALDDEHGKEIAEKKREEREEMREEMKERWEKRKEEIKEYRERLKERVEHIKEMKERYRERYEEEKEYYERIKHRGLNDPEAFRFAKGFVVDGIGFAVAHLDMLEARVIALNLTDNTTAELLNDIDTIKASLEEWRMVINNSTTPEELRNNVNAFREEWQLIKIKIQAVVAKVVALKFEEVIEKAESRTWIIEDKIAKLEEFGLETTEIREAYQEYLNGLAEAKNSILEALQHFENAINADSYEVAKEEYKAGREAYQDAKEKFSDTMDELRDVFKEYAKKMREMGEIKPVEGSTPESTSTINTTATPATNQTETNTTT